MVTANGKSFAELRKASKMAKRVAASNMILAGFTVRYVMAVLNSDPTEREYLDHVAKYRDKVAAERDEQQIADGNLLNLRAATAA